MSKKAMKLALEALEETRNGLAWFYDSYPQDVTEKGNALLPHVETVLAAIREALAEQPAQQTIHCKHRLENNGVCPHHNLHCGWPKCNEPEQPAQQKPVNLRRGDLLRCIETDELCTVWATSPTGNTLIKWSANNFGNYTAEQIGELFWLEPAQQEPVCGWRCEDDDHMPDTWRSDCGVLWTFSDGSPVDNDMKYCCGCGSMLLEKKT